MRLPSSWQKGEKEKRKKKGRKKNVEGRDSSNGKVFLPLLVRKLALPEPTSFFRSTDGWKKKKVQEGKRGTRDDTKFRHNCTIFYASR